MINIPQNWENFYIRNIKLTWDEFFKICQAQKPNNFKPPDWDKAKSVIVEKLAVVDDDMLRDKLNALRTRYGSALKHSALRLVPTEKRSTVLWYLIVRSSIQLSLMRGYYQGREKPSHLIS